MPESTPTDAFSCTTQDQLTAFLTAITTKEAARNALSVFYRNFPMVTWRNGQPNLGDFVNTFGYYDMADLTNFPVINQGPSGPWSPAPVGYDPTKPTIRFLRLLPVGAMYVVADLEYRRDTLPE